MSSNTNPAENLLVSHEASLPQITPEPWLKIGNGDIFLEGPAFDRSGNLIIMAAYDKRVNRKLLRITPDKTIDIILSQKGVRMCGVAIHKDERIFIACLSGELLSVDSNGKNLTSINPRLKGKPEALNDLTFDNNGFLYVTDFIGNPGFPIGGVYRFSPDMKTVETIYQHITSANGVAFTPDGTGLWVSASHSNEVYFLQLGDDKQTLKGVHIPYRLTGMGGGDGLRVDRSGNMYLAVNFEGRVLVLNKHGIPVANVLMPECDKGRLIRTTNLAFKPDSNEVFLLASDEEEAWIYKFSAFAKGVTLYSHL